MSMARIAVLHCGFHVGSHAVYLGRVHGRTLEACPSVTVVVTGPTAPERSHIGKTEAQQLQPIQ